MIEERTGGLLSLVAENAVADVVGSRELEVSGGAVEIVTARGAQEAAAALAAAPCHCVVLELDMPNAAALHFLEAMDGDSALTSVPVLDHNNRRLEADQEQLLQRRTDSQPLELLSSLDELRERIALHLWPRNPATCCRWYARTRKCPRRRGSAMAVSAGRTVLVVDDDARNLYALSGILELHGMQVLHAENGRLGIKALTQQPGISLILMGRDDAGDGRLRRDRQSDACPPMQGSPSSPSPPRRCPATVRRAWLPAPVTTSPSPRRGRPDGPC